jgi:hypothetical protein
MNVVRTVLRRSRRPGEVAIRSIAIRNWCLECVGWEFCEVTRCTGRDCWFRPYRMGPGRTEADRCAAQDSRTIQDDQEEEWPMTPI